ALTVAVAAIGAVVVGQQPPVGAFTPEQAAQGRVAYDANCAGCHRPGLGGSNEAPPLAGSNFLNVWRDRTTRDLFARVQTTMPPGGAGSLSEAPYLNIVSYLLHANGARGAGQPLTPAAAQPIGTIATGQPVRDPGAPPAPGGVPAVGRPGGQAPAPRGLTVSGEVKSYTPVTDDMLRRPDPNDWLIGRGNYQAWSQAA